MWFLNLVLLEKGGGTMKKQIRAIVVSLVLITTIPLSLRVQAKSNLWMLEISEETAAAYNQLCVKDEEGRLYSLSSWVPAPLHTEELKEAGVPVEDYATIYKRRSYGRLESCTEAPIPVVTDDTQLLHYYFGEQSIVSFRKAAFVGCTTNGCREYDIDMDSENVFVAAVGPDDYGVYDLSELEDGLYFVNPGGLVELKRSK